MHINTLDLYGTGDSDSDHFNKLSLNKFVTKNYLSRFQHSFFYADEQITDQAFYLAQDHPSLIVGTNYGRIFIVQCFQDIEGRAFPVAVVDCHQGSPISSLFIGYHSQRRQKKDMAHKD